MCAQRNNISSYNQVWVGPFTKESPSFKDHFCQICVCGWSQIGVFHCTTKWETTKRLFCFDCSNYFLHYLQEQLLWTSCPFWSTSRVIYSRWRRCCPTWTWLKGILTAKWRSTPKCGRRERGRARTSSTLTSVRSANMRPVAMLTPPSMVRCFTGVLFVCFWVWICLWKK